MNEKYILCLQCRGTFSDADVAGHMGCPRCGNTGIPGDVRKRGTVTLTEHEWRIICMWADNWAQQCERKQEGSAAKTMAAIIREIHRQAPDLGALTMSEEMQSLANAVGTVELHQGGRVETFDPEKKQ